MPGVKIDWGNYREEPEGVKIRLTYVAPGMFPDERFVQFQVGGASYTGWMPDYSVNEAEHWLKAYIVTDFDDGRFLLRIPDETLTSGVRVYGKAEDYGTTVVTGWW